MNIQADYSPTTTTELCTIMEAAGANIRNETHNYTCLYDPVLRGVRAEPIRLLHFGLDASGGDLNTLAGWRTYFTHPDAYIAGIDRDISDADLPVVDGAHTFSFDWKDPSGLATFWEGQTEPFDIVIDNGRWNPADKAVLLGMHAKHIKKGGVYIIQNVHWRESYHWMGVKQRWDQMFPGIKFRFLSVPHPTNRVDNIVIMAQIEDATMHPYVPHTRAAPAPTPAPAVVETSTTGNQIVE